MSDHSAMFVIVLLVFNVFVSVSILRGGNEIKRQN